VIGRTAKLTTNRKTYGFPIAESTEGERTMDIYNLRKETGINTLDPGYANTGCCESNITFTDDEKGILR
jgi:citrate synthase